MARVFALPLGTGPLVVEAADVVIKDWGLQGGEKRVVTASIDLEKSAPGGSV